MPRPKLKIIPLGGLSEIGKNMMVIEYDGDILLVDAGLMFPEEEMHGVDLVIQDISYLEDKTAHIKGLVITHGHEDHIGAIPYLLPRLKCPVISTRLTNGLISVKLKEHHALAGADLRVLAPDGRITLGRFRVEFYPVCHSIPDSVGLIIHTPVGVIVHSGDFKIDFTPVTGAATNLSRLAQVGSQGVLLLLSDSTYAELPGYTPSETIVGRTLDRIMDEAPGRVIIATFASLVSRIQQVIDAAEKHNRRMFVVGRNMTEIVRMSLEMGYLKDPRHVLAKMEQLKDTPHDRTVFMTTGSQGEPTSALVRMVNKDHRQLHILKGDTVAISASPIPGNEALIARTIDNLFRQGAQVFYYGSATPVHVHGHASQEELKLLINVVKPRYFVPVHGEYRHLSIHAQLAETVGVPRERIFVIEDGDVLELDESSARVTGRVSASHVYVDGLSVGDIDQVVLRDRQMLARDGMVVVIIAVNRQTGKLVGRPDIVSRGFVEPTDYTEMLARSRDLVAELMERGGELPPDWGFVNTRVRDVLSRFYYEQTKRHPMILPFMVKV